ncbi:putative E3 ubiquitin-protein ligase ATL44 [Zea mays]|uniref:RING-type E3 ubiquitin transferase n=1 Tax=Zea mays TaxID=4577 RepID=A0A3L6G399_MAIZE|nr:putative E3 ubiquitin-protein ligase ATL44 [Zea mays]
MHGAARKLMWGSSPDRPDDHDVVIVLASLLCALITVLGIGLVARCACARGPSAQAAAAANRGVKKSVLRRIPTVPYAAACSQGEGDDADECAICLAEFEEGEPTRVLPQCGHAFHAACVDRWLRAHSSCPSCRRILSLQLPPGERCRRCGARPLDDGDAGWKPTYYSAMPPFLA